VNHRRCPRLTANQTSNHDQFDDPAEPKPTSFRALDFWDEGEQEEEGRRRQQEKQQQRRRRVEEPSLQMHHGSIDGGAPGCRILVGTPCELWEVPGAALGASKVGRVWHPFVLLVFSFLGLRVPGGCPSGH
jgi:hypothetical protein